MSRNRTAFLLVAAVAAVVVTFAIWRSGKSPQDTAEVEKASGTAVTRAADPAPTGSSDASRSLHDESTATREVPATQRATLTLRQQFIGANDYDEFIGGIVEDAEAGNIDAQYYVYAALSYCDREFRPMFRRRNGSGWLTLDETLQRVVRRREQSIEVVQAIDRRCRTLIESARAEFGDADKWLQRSATGGQPLALTSLAESQLLDQRLGKRSKDATKPGGALDAMSARDLLMTALKSKEPEVLWRIGQVQGLLGGSSEDSTKAQWAWLLAACERGYECGPDNPWLEFSCRLEMCLPGETAVDYMKRTLQTDFPAIEELARDINSKIDAEAWSELQIGG